MDDMKICDDHCDTFAPRKHPDAKAHGHESTLPDNHKRGVGHPAHHSRGKLPSQLQPDHGPHKGAGKHM